MYCNGIIYSFYTIGIYLSEDKHRLVTRSYLDEVYIRIDKKEAVIKIGFAEIPIKNNEYHIWCEMLENISKEYERISDFNKYIMRPKQIDSNDV